MTCRMQRIFLFVILLGLFLGTLFPRIAFFREFVLGVGIGAVIAMALIWVPILSKLRRRVNGLIREVGVKQ